MSADTTTQTDTSTGFQAIIQADVFEQFVENAQAVVDEATLHVEADGLHMSAVDPANVGMVAQDLDAGAFESYEAGGATIGVNLERLAEVLGLAESGELCRIVRDGTTRELQRRLPETEDLDIETGIL